jgi:hypothetical protein
MLFEMNTRGMVALAIQFLLPLLVGLVTKRSWPDGLKAVLLLALTALGQFLLAYQDSLGAGEHFVWQSWLWSTVVGFAIAVAVHFGLWKPTGASATAQDAVINDKAPAHRGG